MRKINRSEADIFRETALKYSASSNFFRSPEVLYNYADRGGLYLSETRAGIFVFADAGDYFRLYYVLTDGDTEVKFETPPEFKPVVTETAYRVELPSSVNYFIGRGFKNVLTRSRMSLRININDNTEDDCVGASAPDRVYNLFRASFDIYTGCIPSPEELRNASDEGRIISVSDNGGLCGALLFEDAGAASVLSNIAVDSNKRGQGYGSILVSSWIRRCAGKPVLRLWVAEGNAAAVKLYEKHGFKADGMKSAVLIK